ncbi:MAG TPA: hypothetical protein VK927_07645 [Adhaeribacter sp.]|nr:hypothetical protein [Adhaeribacter sp.]
MPKQGSLLFYLKTLPFLTVMWFFALQAQAQVPDTVYTKPELNQGLPPAVVQPPVLVSPPAAPRVMDADSLNKAAKAARQKTEDERPPFLKRFFTGGGFAISFGTYTFIQVTPILAYRLTDRISIGCGLSYIYVSDSFDQLHIWGGKAFTQVMVYKSFFGHLEYEVLDFKDTFPVVIAGAGYRQMFSDKVGMDTMLLFDINNNERSYYRNPIIRATFIINL